MKLIEIKKLIPLRNETGAIYKFEASDEMINPTNILRVRFEKAVEHPVISMIGGMEIVVEETMYTFGVKFEEATE